MKTAIYIENGLTQLVLTPQSDFEKGVVSKIEKGEQGISIHTGRFYLCQGGWITQGRYSDTDDSLIIVMEIKEVKE